MLKAQLKSNFDPTFLLSLKKKKKTDLEERESLQLEREWEIWPHKLQVYSAEA